MASMEYEKKYYSEGYKSVVGMDEAGRGPLAGPLVIACVILPSDYENPNIDDSKKISEKKRKELEMEEWRDSHIKSFHYEGRAPFHFDRDTYLYLENNPNETLNQCVIRNLNKIENIFNEYGFRFIYLPNWEPDRSNIDLANLTDEQTKKVHRFLDKVNTVKYTRLLCDALHIDKKEIDSGIFHFACYMYDDSLFKTEILQTRFTHFSMHDVTDDTIEAFCRK